MWNAAGSAVLILILIKSLSITRLTMLQKQKTILQLCDHFCMRLRELKASKVIFEK